MIKQPLKVHGGKRYLADWIINHMPPHVHYVEPYAGGLAVLLRKPYNGISEVVNDLNMRLMTFWKVIRDPLLFSKLQRRLALTPFSEVEFRDSLFPCKDPVEIASRVFVRARQSRQAIGQDFATLTRNRTRRKMNEQVSSWLSAVDGLPEVHERLQRVVILSREAVDVIRSQDGPNTLFYLDPPYLHESRVTTGEYDYEMLDSQHERLLNILGDIEGKFILSGYHSRMYDEFSAANGWKTDEIEVSCRSSSAKQRPKRKEVIWMNY